jgi:peptidoglycan/LPS O-acetylase OafA/YrhL
VTSQLNHKPSLVPLTSLRFVAAALILVEHGFDSAGIPRSTFPYDQGVSFFFVLSGFVLAYNYPKLHGREIRSFLIFRVGRIWPAHIVTAIVAWVIAPALDIKFIANAGMVHAWIPIESWYFSYNAVSWSISTEFFFYLAFVLLIVRWSATFWWKLLTCAAMLWSIMAISYYLKIPSLSAETSNTITLHGLLYVGPLARLLEFAAGMATCLLYGWLLPRARGPIYMFTALELLALAVAGYVMDVRPLHAVLTKMLPPTSPEYLGHAESWPAFLPLVLLFALQRGHISQLLSLKFAVLLGEASYSLYLVHQMVFATLISRTTMIGWPAFVIGALLSQMLAFALFRLVENPARQYVKRALAPDRTFLKKRAETSVVGLLSAPAGQQAKTVSFDFMKPAGDRSAG